MQAVIRGYDDPSILQGSATSVIHNVEDKQAFLYLCEKGSTILQYPTQLLPGASSVNPFTLGFQMASHFPMQVQAYLALGAAHMSRGGGQSQSLALKHYISVVAALRTELEDKVLAYPRESTCAVAAILCVYELVTFTSVQHRLVHLNGYYKLMEARLAEGATWGPFQVLVDHYIHSFAINALSHFAYHVGDKDINYITNLVFRFKSRLPGLGREIVGIPADLTIAVYKLTFLLHQNTAKSPWNLELNAVSKLVSGWYPPAYALTSNATGLRIVGQLYQLACTCVVYYLHDKTVRLNDTRIAQAVEESVQVVESFKIHEYAFNCLSWALIVLGLFAVTSNDRDVLMGPLRSLTQTRRMGGYRTAVEFLNTAWRRSLGPTALDDKALLATLSI